MLIILTEGVELLYEKCRLDLDQFQRLWYAVYVKNEARYITPTIYFAHSVSACTHYAGAFFVIFNLSVKIYLFLRKSNLYSSKNVSF